MSWWKFWGKDPPPEPQLALPAASIGGGYNGSKFPGGWNASADVLIDSVLEMDYPTLRARSQELFEQNLYGRGLIRRLVTNEVHTGLSLEADPSGILLGIEDDELEDWSDRTEAKFNAWADSPSACDYERRVEMTFGELTASQRREALVGGDVLIVPRINPKTNLPAIQVISGHLVQTPFAPGDKRRIEHGVELDNAGRHLAYHVADSKTGKFTRIPAFGSRSGRRTAWLVYGTDKRVGQVRGTPLLALVMQSLKEIDRFRDAALRKAVINSILTMWIEKSENKAGSTPWSNSASSAGTVADNDGAGNNREFLSAGQVPGLIWEELQHGEKPHSFKSDSGESVQFPQFEGAIVAAIAWACEMPAEILRLAFDSNYSASQAALHEFNMYLGLARERIARSFTQPIYEQWLVASVNAGSIVAPGLIASAADISQFETYRAWVTAEWLGSVKPPTDLWKLVRATGEMLDRNLMTHAQATRQLTGRKFSNNIRKISREREQILALPAPPDEDATAGATLRVLGEAIEDAKSLVDTPDS